MAGTLVPSFTFGPTGFVAPSASAVLAGVQGDINAAFGGNLNYQLTTPQGQLASSWGAIIDNAYANFQYFTQQVDPAYASGRMQDAIGRLYGQTRNPPLPTQLQISCVGASGVQIPVNSLIQDGSGNLYQATAGGTIPVGGSITLQFNCTVPGPVPIPSTNQVSIYQSIPGWDAVSVVSGVVGNNVETRSQFEARRQQSLAKNSNGTLPAILGAVLAVPGVLDAYVLDNPTNSAITVGTVTIPANSLYVAVTAGTATSTAVAQAIWSKKSPGCSYYPGNTTVTVTDPSPQYAPPAPSYQVSYQATTNLPIFYLVNLRNNPGIPANALSLIQGAIASSFAGNDNGPKATIGALLTGARYIPNIAALGTWAQIITITLGSSNTPGCSFTGSVSGTTLTVTAVSFGAIGVNNGLADGSNILAPGTFVVGFLTGTGGVGTYLLNQSQTVASEVMSAFPVSAPQVAVPINQEPTLNVADILLVLT